MKILFAGTPEFAVPALNALINEHQVIGVYTQPDRPTGRGKVKQPPPVKDIALRYNLRVFQPNTLAAQEDTIAQLKPDVMVVVAYGMILPQSILDIPKWGCLNIHASLLPKWRGAAPIQRAIESGDKKTGVSIMQMKAGLDTGPVYQMFDTHISPNDTSTTLHKDLADIGAKGIIEVLHNIKNKPHYQPTPQDDSQATYAHKINKQEGIIQWQQSASQLQQKIRAFNPWPICQTNHKQKTIRILQSEPVVDMHTDKAPGSILDIKKEGIFIQTGQGVLIVQTLQKPGGKPLTAQQFCQGYPLSINDIFGDTLDINAKQ